MKQLLILMLISILVYFSNLGGSSIYVLDEAKNAGCAMEMDARNDVVVPTFNGELRTDKPPLHYFMMMTAFHVWGVTPFAARFFSALCGVALIAFIFWRVRNIMNESIAFLVCLVYLSSLQTGIQFHLAVPDPYLILLMTVCLMSMYSALQDDSRQIYLMYISASLAFLTKGLIAVLFPTLIIFFYLSLTRQLTWKKIRGLKIVQGSLLFLLISLPWYWAVGYTTNGLWLEGFFISHNVNRYTSTMEGHGGFPMAAFVILFASLLPFSVFILQAVKTAILKREEHPLLLFSLIVVLVITIFFSFSKTILPSYVAPATPFVAILIGYYLQVFPQDSGIARGNHFSILLGVIISLAIPVAISIALQQEENLSSLSRLWILFCLLPIGSLVGWFLLTKNRKLGFLYAWASTWIMTLMLFFYVAYPLVDDRNPVTQSLALIRTTYPEYEIIAYKTFNPAYVFALQHTIPLTESLNSISDITSQDKKLIILTSKRHFKDLSVLPMLKVIYRGRDLFEGSETVVLAN